MSFVAGLLSFLSPCILPLVPAYLGFLTGSAVNALADQGAKANLMFKALGFVFGFSLVLLLWALQPVNWVNSLQSTDPF